MPSLVRRKSFRRQRYLRRQARLEIIVRHFQERQQFPHHDSDVLFVDEGVG